MADPAKQPFRKGNLFPLDVIFDVLAKSPVKTLLRFKCVCKDWNSIITDHTFIKSHLLSQPDGQLFSHYYEPSSSSCADRTQLCSFYPDRSFSFVRRLKVPFPCSSRQEPCCILVGSLNGLLCFTNFKSFGRVLHLWNPSIRKYKTLHKTCLFNGKYRQRFSHPRTIIVFGLGFRDLTRDHIVVRIAVFKWSSRRFKRKLLPLAEICSLSTESWRTLALPEDISKRLMNIESWRYAHVNGDLNWLAIFSDEEGRTYQSILSFDVNKEEFRQIKLPNDYKNGMNCTFQRIVLYKGSLAVIIYGESKSGDGNWYVCKWAMKQYGKEDSWSRKRVKSEGKNRLHGCTMDGRIIFREAPRSVCLFDVDTLEEEELHLPSFQSVHTFKESIVSLDGDHVVSETP